jgi:hypothetical protein
LGIYHERIHFGIGCTPLQKRSQTRNCCRPLPPGTDVEALFRMERRCRVYKDSTIQFKKRKFEVPGCLPSSRVKIYYMPWDTENIYFGEHMAKARMIDLGTNARRFENPNGRRT